MQLHLQLEHTNGKCLIQHNYYFPFLFDSRWVACNFRISWRLDWGMKKEGFLLSLQGYSISVNLNQLEVSFWLPSNINCFGTEVVHIYVPRRCILSSWKKLIATECFLWAWSQTKGFTWLSHLKPTTTIWSQNHDRSLHLFLHYSEWTCLFIQQAFTEAHYVSGRGLGPGHPGLNGTDIIAPSRN